MQSTLANIGIDEEKLPGLVRDPDEEPNQERVELFLSCRKLKNMDVFSLTDPKIRVYAIEKGIANLIGETERIQDNLNPDFAKSFILQYKFETKQQLRFEVLTSDGSNKNSLVGNVETTLGEIVGSKNQTAIFNIQNKDKLNGKLIVRSERVNETHLTASFEIHARKLRNKHGWFKTSSPYFKLTRMTGDSGKVVVYESEIIKHNLNPQWKSFGIPMQKLCNGDQLRPVNLEIYTRKVFTEKLIGQCTFTVDELINQEKREFVLNKPNKKYKPGIAHIKNFSVEVGKGTTKATFLDYLRGGVQLSVAIAVDFTASNGLPSNASSLHAINKNGQLNQYQQAIEGVCEILLCYDYDKKVPVYGFGGIPSGVPKDPTSHCFALSGNENDPWADGLEGIMNVYKKALGKVALNGPTHFSKILEEIMKQAEQNKKEGSKEYIILLILTDGLIHDMQPTINCLINSAFLPMSVIIVGVGNADFTNMDILDGDNGLQNNRGVKAQRDLVQFVPFNKVKGNKEELAKEVLAEVPTQLLEYMEAMKIKPGNKEDVDYDRLLSFKHQNSLNDIPGLINLDQLNAAQGFERASTLQHVGKQGGQVPHTGTIGEFGR